jgi:hypothetical protein
MNDKDFYYTKFYSVYNPDGFTIWKVRNDHSQEICVHDPHNEYDKNKWQQYRPAMGERRQVRISREDAFLLMI